MSHAPATLDDLRDALRRFAAARDWEQFHTPKNLAMALNRHHLRAGVSQPARGGIPGRRLTSRPWRYLRCRWRRRTLDSRSPPHSGHPGVSGQSMPMTGFEGRIQPVDATVWLNISAGVWKPRVFLGLSFNCLATALSLACE